MDIFYHTLLHYIIITFFFFHLNVKYIYFFLKQVPNQQLKTILQTTSTSKTALLQQNEKVIVRINLVLRQLMALRFKCQTQVLNHQESPKLDFKMKAVENMTSTLILIRWNFMKALKAQKHCWIYENSRRKSLRLEAGISEPHTRSVTRMVVKNVTKMVTKKIMKIEMQNKKVVVLQQKLEFKGVDAKELNTSASKMKIETELIQQLNVQAPTTLSIISIGNSQNVPPPSVSSLFIETENVKAHIEKSVEIDYEIVAPIDQEIEKLEETMQSLDQKMSIVKVVATEAKVDVSSITMQKLKPIQKKQEIRKRKVKVEVETQVPIQVEERVQETIQEPIQVPVKFQKLEEIQKAKSPKILSRKQR